jgi:hypothetical protein
MLSFSPEISLLPQLLPLVLYFSPKRCHVGDYRMGSRRKTSRCPLLL